MVTKDKMTRCLITFSQLVYMENAEENMNFDDGTQRVKKIQLELSLRTLRNTRHVCQPQFSNPILFLFGLSRAVDKCKSLMNRLSYSCRSYLASITFTFELSYQKSVSSRRLLLTLVIFRCSLMSPFHNSHNFAGQILNIASFVTH